MSCDPKNHQMHMCALKAQGLEDCIKSFSDKPTVECRKCGVKANSSKNLCAAHLGDWAPNVEGGHGSVGLEDVGKAHEGAEVSEEPKAEPEIAIKQVPMDGVCGGY
jgi:hypothetical protein